MQGTLRWQTVQESTDVYCTHLATSTFCSLLKSCFLSATRSEGWSARASATLIGFYSDRSSTTIEAMPAVSCAIAASDSVNPPLSPRDSHRAWFFQLLFACTFRWSRRSWRSRLRPGRLAARSCRVSWIRDVVRICRRPLTPVWTIYLACRDSGTCSRNWRAPCRFGPTFSQYKLVHAFLRFLWFFGVSLFSSSRIRWPQRGPSRSSWADRWASVRRSSIQRSPAPAK